MSATDSTMISTTSPATTAQSPAPRIVHLFIDGDDQFVMTDELKMAVKDTPYNPDPAHSWYTMNGDIARKMTEKSEHPIEFIPTPIIREAQVTSVITPTGIDVVLATDALLDAIAFLIFKLGIFQIPDPEHWQTLKVVQFHQTLEMVFDVKKTSKFFIPVAILYKLNQLACEEFAGFPEAKPVTSNRLVEQLIELGILSNQVEISLYNTFMSCDFKKNIGIMACAVSCVVEKIPQISKFFHDQKACKHLMVCSICVENEKNLKVVDDKQKADILLKVLELTVGSQQVEASKKIQKKKKRSAHCKRPRKTSTSEEDPESPEVVNEAPDIPEVLKDLPMTSEVSKDIPTTSEPQPTCQKCTRTTARCNEAKEKLKESQKSTEKIEKKYLKERKEWEKKLAEKEMELEELKRKFAKYQEESAQKLEAKDEEIMALKTDLATFEGRNKRLQMENDKLVEENLKLQEQVDLVEEAAQGEEEILEEEPIDFEQMLEDLLDKQFQLTQANPFDAAAKEVRKLKALIEDLAIHEFADMELEHFEEQFLVYSSALEQNIAAIQSDNLEAVIPLPDYPKLSDKFKKALELAQEQRNKQLELECVICSDEMDLEKKEELFECPVCGKSVHLVCIETWFNTTRNCVHCRAQWN